MAAIKYFLGEQIPLEMHKVRVVQRLELVPIERRAAAIEEAQKGTAVIAAVAIDAGKESDAMTVDGTEDDKTKGADHFAMNENDQEEDEEE